MKRGRYIQLFLVCYCWCYSTFTSCYYHIKSIAMGESWGGRWKILLASCCFTVIFMTYRATLSLMSLGMSNDWCPLEQNSCQFGSLSYQAMQQCNSIVTQKLGKDFIPKLLGKAGWDLSLTAKGLLHVLRGRVYRILLKLSSQARDVLYPHNNTEVCC